jgi:DNA transformation protein
MDPEHIRELFAPFRPVTVKRMFGGVGIFADGLAFAVVFDDVIYLRVDATSIPDFEREGSSPFVYPFSKRPEHLRRKSTSFWRLPERLYDDPDDLAVWAARAFTIAELRKVAPRAPTRKKAAPERPAPKKPAPKKSASKTSASKKPTSKRPAD